MQFLDIIQCEFKVTHILFLLMGLEMPKNMFKCNAVLFLVSLISCVVWCPNYGVALSIGQNDGGGGDSSNRNSVDANNVGGRCNTDRLAVYKVVLHTYWTRDLFPKHYPDWRPPAQWTKTFGKL